MAEHRQGEQTIIPPRPPQRSSAIKGLTPRLPERGKIKIGGLGAERQSKGGGTYRLPMKHDHFTVTTLERGPDGNFAPDAEVHAMLGGDKPTDIPVRLLYDDQSLNMPTRYACYKGKALWCSGDGEQAMRLDEQAKEYRPCSCPCPRKEPTYDGNDPCKMNGNLSVMVDGAGGLGGVWNFRTTSYNSIVGILSSMSFLKTITGGLLANIPLRLTVRPKQVSLPKDPTKTSTVYVVGLEFRGDQKALQAAGQQLALERATHHVRIENIEHEARRLLAAPVDVPLPGDNNDDVVEEFYPEQVEAMEIVRHDEPTVARPVKAAVAEDKPAPVQGEILPPDAPSDGDPREAPPRDQAPTDTPHPFAIMDAEGTEHLYPKGSDYLKALEKLFDEAPDAFGFWDSNSEHFSGWQHRLLLKAERDGATAADKKASEAFNVVGKRIVDRLAMLAKGDAA